MYFLSEAHSHSGGWLVCGQACARGTGRLPIFQMKRQKRVQLLRIQRYVGKAEKKTICANKTTQSANNRNVGGHQGDSVYDFILPMSITYRPTQQKQEDDTNSSKHDFLDPPGKGKLFVGSCLIISCRDSCTCTCRVIFVVAAPDGFQVMPLVSHLKEGTLAGKPAGWHRNAERRARGMFPVKGLAVQLEPWERQLVGIVYEPFALCGFPTLSQ